LEKTITDINGATREVNLFLTNSEIQPHYDDAYKKAQPKIDLKGFRKGKVPLPMIKKFFGERIEADALEDISGKIFADFIKSDEVHVIGQPSLTNIEKEKEGVKFVIRYDIMPEFEMSDYRSLTIDEPVHPVTDEEIEEVIDNLCKSNGKFEVADEVTDELFVVGIKLREIDSATGLYIIGAEPQESHVYLADKSVIPELREQIINKKLGDTFNFTPLQYDKNAPDKTYKIEITEIQKVIPVEFTNELVDSYTQGRFKSTEEYREEVGSRLQEEWNHKSRQQMEEQIISKMVDGNEFDVPESVIDSVIHAMFEDFRKQYGKPGQPANLDFDTMAEGLYPIAEKTVRWEIIRNNIIKKENLEVEDQDIEELVEIEKTRTKGDPETIRRALLQNKNITENILHKKVMDFILDFAVTNEVSFDDIAHEHEHNHDHEHEHHHDHEHEHHHEHEHDHEHEN